MAMCAAPTELQAVVGGRAELPCNVSLQSAADKVSLVLWYRGDNKLPLYSVDARAEPRHFPAEPLGARAYFDMAAEPPVLRVEPVHEKDAALYRCRVDYRWGRTFSTFSQLHVVGLLLLLDLRHL
ncbi:hypothetical protein LAZ67_4000027 [Cordylochernes scorpioides]|uniref:Ig-like domain-containing protein n=1 Tax=Cordylochernes scorpioides TaxID=51811 RepID=A0ABY6KCG0_9ARAC|nr:hypothetical protein LAZ67_4000027 [Cordylochernes scorpioides]